MHTMFANKYSRLSKKKHYLQIAFNSTLEDARSIITQLPASDRIIIEAGTPLIKRYGMEAVRLLHSWYAERLFLSRASDIVQSPVKPFGILGVMAEAIKKSQQRKRGVGHTTQRDFSFSPYVVADMKTMDRGYDEVAMAVEAGASAVIALGSAPIETLNVFIDTCEKLQVDAMIDMMNIEFPLPILSALKNQPRVVILHRGVDEERDNREKTLPLMNIRRIKGARDVLISIAGGDTPREVQSAIFNDADVVVVWKSVYENNADTIKLVNTFLSEVK